MPPWRRPSTSRIGSRTGRSRALPVLPRARGAGLAVSPRGGPAIHRSGRRPAWRRHARSHGLARTTHRGSSRPALGPSLHSHRGNRSRNGLRRDGGIVRRARALVRAPLRGPPRPRAPGARAPARRAGACGPWTPAAAPASRRRSWRSSATRRSAWISRPGSCARRVPRCGRAPAGAGRRRGAPVPRRDARPRGLVREHPLLRPEAGPGGLRDRAGPPARRAGPSSRSSIAGASTSCGGSPRARWAIRSATT